MPRIAGDVTRAASVKDVRLAQFRETRVNLEDCAQLLSGMAEVEEWQLELRTRPGDRDDADELLIRVATRGGADRARVAARVREQLRDRLGLASSRVEFVSLEPLLQSLGTETEAQERRLVDARTPR